MAALDDLIELDLAAANEEWQDFEGSTQPAAASEVPAPTLAPTSTPASAPAPAQAELDLLDFDAPVEEQPIKVSTTQAAIPLDFGMTANIAPQPLQQASDVNDDEWTEFEEVPPASQELPAKSDQVTPEELELLAEQLQELKQYECAYQCLHFCEVRARPLQRVCVARATHICRSPSLLRDCSRSCFGATTP